MRKKKIFSEAYLIKKRILKGIKNRCYRKNDKEYHNYGGRGITVCERWRGKGGLYNFNADIEDRPSNRHSIDRKDTNGNYEPSNVKWSTNKEQCRNMRRNRNLVYKGKKKCVSEWAEIIGVDESVIRYRVRQQWPIEEVLGYKPHKQKSDNNVRKVVDTNTGKVYSSLVEVSEIFKINKSTLCNKLRGLGVIRNKTQFMYYENYIQSNCQLSLF